MAKTFLLILAVVISLCMFACAENRRATGALSERVREFTDPSQTIEVAVGEKFSIALDSNPTTGHTWSWQKQDERGKGVVAFRDSRFVAPRTDLVGAGGREHMTFRATTPGTEKLTFHYHRPWEKNVEPAKTVVFTVTVR